MIALYTHRKGGQYLVATDLRVSDSTNARAGTDVVLYYSLVRMIWHVRARAEFFEVIEWPDGTRRPRFVPVDGNLKPTPPDRESKP